MRKRLSSSMTSILTIFVVVSLMLGLVLILFGIMIEPMVLIATVAYLVTALPIFYIVRLRHKTVHIDDTHLYISSLFGEVAVELEEIEEVKDVWFTSPRFIVIQFYHQQSFGK